MKTKYAQDHIWFFELMLNKSNVSSSFSARKSCRGNSTTSPISVTVRLSSCCVHVNHVFFSVNTQSVRATKLFHITNFQSNQLFPIGGSAALSSYTCPSLIAFFDKCASPRIVQFKVYFSIPTSAGSWEEVGSEKYSFTGPGLKVYF